MKTQLALKCNHTCRTLNEDRVHRLVDVVDIVISFMNTKSKVDLYALGMYDR